MSAQSITLYCSERYAGAALSSPVTRVAVVPHDDTTFDVFIANASGPCSVGDCASVGAFLATLSWLASSIASVQPAVLQPVAVALDVYVPNANMSTAAADVTAFVAYLGAAGMGGRVSADDIAKMGFLVSYVQDTANATVDGGTAPVTIAKNAIASPTTAVRVHGTG